MISRKITLFIWVFFLPFESGIAQTEYNAAVGTGKYAEVDQCSAGSHLKCVYTTAKEVFEEGKDGKISQHWWKKSYIGRAYTEKYGKVIGGIYEGIFIVPLYVSMAFVNLTGWIVGKFKRSKKKEEVQQDLTEPIVLDL